MQASTNTLLAHFASLLFSLWLIRVVGSPGRCPKGHGQPQLEQHLSLGSAAPVSRLCRCLGQCSLMSTEQLDKQSSPNALASL